jgi:hypothetical protein
VVRFRFIGALFPLDRVLFSPLPDNCSDKISQELCRAAPAPRSWFHVAVNSL